MNDPSTPSRPATNATEYTVSELSNSIRRALEDGFGFVRLRGEISGYRGPHGSGHCYFALKDDKAKIEAVIWRSAYQRLKIKPAEGMEVVALGRVTTFPGSSKYQIVVEMLEPAGVGALMALLEERKRKLAAEGLFEDSRKRPLPFLPRVVGIVTSPTGAVIRDMLHGFEERFPTRVVVWPVRVQGDGSAAEIAAAISGFNALPPAGGRVPKPDVLIVARGGGSLEDLWSFNDELVVRAAATSQIPIISAVGHETDWSLLDLVSDARAPTPTKAAEWAVPKYADLTESTAKYALRLATAMRRHLEAQRTHLRASARGLPSRDALLALPRQRFDACDKRLGLALLANTRAHTLRHARLASRLHPRLLQTRLTRAHDRLERAAQRSTEALWRVTADRRSRYDRITPRAIEALSRGTTARRTRFERVAQRSTDALARGTAARRARFERLAGRLTVRPVAERVERGSERLSALDKRATRALANIVTQRRRKLDAGTQLLVSLSYRSILNRGYAVVRDAKGAMLRSASRVTRGDRLNVEFADGRVAADAVDSTTTASPTLPSNPPTPSAPEATPAAPSRTARAPKRPGPDDQGSLF